MFIMCVCVRAVSCICLQLKVSCSYGDIATSSTKRSAHNRALDVRYYERADAEMCVRTPISIKNIYILYTFM